MKRLHSITIISGLILILQFQVSAQFFRNPVVSPEIAEDQSVTFRIYAPKAEEVKLQGNWMPFMQQSLMTKNDTGLWSLKIEPLAPELYGYSFIVDGVNTLDPSNLLIKRDGTFRNESVLFIRGKGSELYEPKVGPKGTVHQVWYESPTLNLTRRMYVYTPPGYEKSKDSYPVLYLLHGGGGDEDAWTTLGLAPTIMDNLINSGQAVPMLVVMTNGNPDQAADISARPYRESASMGGVGMANQKFEESLVKDVIPYIESNFRVKKGRVNRALTGLSMGGLQTINSSFNYPETYNYYGVMSMGFADLSRFGIQVDLSQRDTQIKTLKASKPALYWIACGKEDFLYESVVTMRTELDKLDFPYIYRESDGGHTWTNWRIYLSEFAPKLFK